MLFNYIYLLINKKEAVIYLLKQYYTNGNILRVTGF